MLPPDGSVGLVVVAAHRVVRVLERLADLAPQHLRDLQPYCVIHRIRQVAPMSITIILLHARSSGN